jgi:hypothetical protein
MSDDHMDYMSSDLEGSVDGGDSNSEPEVVPYTRATRSLAYNQAVADDPGELGMAFYLHKLDTELAQKARLAGISEELATKLYQHSWGYGNRALDDFCRTGEGHTPVLQSVHVEATTSVLHIDPVTNNIDFPEDSDTPFDRRVWTAVATYKLGPTRYSYVAGSIDADGNMEGWNEA